MSHLIISKKNEVYLQVEAEPHVYYELRDAFQFEVPNAKFAPAYKNKWWDGFIYLFLISFEISAVLIVKGKFITFELYPPPGIINGRGIGI